MKESKNSKDFNLNHDFSQSKIAIVVSSYHSQITQKLLEGALEIFKLNGIQNIEILEVPGAYELLYGVQKAFIKFPELSGVATLGCVIKGDTDHDVYINHAVAQGLVQLQLSKNIPIAFGLLTVNNFEQAYDRSFGEVGNKGIEVALALLNCIKL